ncbi:MAG: hypothetical protein MI923_12285 [Phycisphaerales bacterium]|nr:hypothetical protein [Phycisphaerales bacterium]
MEFGKETNNATHVTFHATVSAGMRARASARAGAGSVCTEMVHSIRLCPSRTNCAERIRKLQIFFSVLEVER